MNNYPTEQNKPNIHKWTKYIFDKINEHSLLTQHSNIITRLKHLNNNHEHITPEIIRGLEHIIDKIAHAFSSSLITIYDTNIFDVLFDICRTHISEYLPEYLPEYLLKYIHNFINKDNSPWLYTLQQGFITTLGLIREHILLTHDNNPNILLEAHINESIYNIINCWVISCITLLFCKALFSLDTLSLNLPYLFFVAGSYSIVDFAIDDNIEPQVIRNILQLFEHELTAKCMNPNQNQNQSPEQPPEQYIIYKSIRHLVKLFTQHADPNATKLQAIIYSMTTEKECFKLQRAQNNGITSLSIHDIITLTINKGLSTGYLILAGLSQNIYDICVHANNHKQLNIFNQYCILLQLLDDLSDYSKDSAAGITTSAALFQGAYSTFAWFVLDCVLDFLEMVMREVAGIFDMRISNAFNILFINYWCYCCNKNMSYIILDAELISVITDNYMFDMEYILQMREQKHKKKYELYKLLLNA